MWSDYEYRVLKTQITCLNTQHMGWKVESFFFFPPVPPQQTGEALPDTSRDSGGSLQVTARRFPSHWLMFKRAFRKKKQTLPGGTARINHDNKANGS